MPRFKLGLPLLSLALLATPAYAEQLHCDGPYAADSSAARLIETFGAANVVTGEVPGPEGSTVIATTVFPDDPERKMEFGWWDEENYERLAYFTVPTADTAPNGLKAGMSIDEVQELNGAPFELSGFWWDYGGYASFTGGKLGDVEGGCTVSVQFQPRVEDLEGVDVDAVAGDRQVESTEPLLRTVDARIDSITVGYRDYAEMED